MPYSGGWSDPHGGGRGVTLEAESMWARSNMESPRAGTSSSARRRSTNGSGVAWTSSARVLPDHDPYRAWSIFEVQTSDGAIPRSICWFTHGSRVWLVECKGVGRASTVTPAPGPVGMARNNSEDNPVLLANRRGKGPGFAASRVPGCPRQSPTAWLRRTCLLSADDVPVRLDQRSPQSKFADGPASRPAPSRRKGTFLLHSSIERLRRRSRSSMRPLLTSGGQGPRSCDGAGGHSTATLAAGGPTGGRLYSRRPDADGP